MRYFKAFCLIIILHLSEVKGFNEITVVVSQTDPISAQNKNSSEITGIGCKIIETFAKKMRYDVEFIEINETLNDVFHTEKSFDQFSQSFQS